MIVHLSLWKGPVKPKLLMRTIAEEVAARHGLTLDQLKEHTNRHNIAHPRQEAMWVMVQQRGANLSAIGRFFGVHHTTVRYGVRAHEARMGELEAA